MLEYMNPTGYSMNSIVNLLTGSHKTAWIYSGLRMENVKGAF